MKLNGYNCKNRMCWHCDKDIVAQCEEDSIEEGTDFTIFRIRKKR